MRKQLLPAHLCALISIATIAPASADELAQNKPPSGATVNTLDSVTVYATRNPSSTFSVPAMVTTVDAEAPGTATASTLSDLLKVTPSVDIENGARRNGQTVSIRGFDDESVITLIDGRRQNFEAVHDGRYFIDPALLKSVEIVRGASSSIYGGGGIGGVVAFDTKDASDLLAPGQTLGALTSFAYRSANGESAPLVAAFGRAQGLDVLGSVSYRRSGDIQLGNVSNQSGGNTLLTRDRMVSGLVKAGYTIADFHTIKAQYEHHQNESNEPNNGAGAITSSNPVVAKKVNDDQFSLKYQFEDPTNTWLNPKLHLYHNATSVEEKDISGSNAARIQTRDLATLGFTADNQTRLAAINGIDQTLSYGFEIYSDSQKGSNSKTGTRAGVPVAEATTYGLYLQDEATLTTSLGRFLLTPAARFDKFQSDDETGQSQSESRLSPKVALSYEPNSSVMFYGSWAQAFRAPNLTELYPSGQHFPGNNFISNPDLKPETVTTVELGAGIRFDNLFAENDGFRLKGAVHRSRGDDFIDQEITGTTTKNLNVPKALIMGYELEGEYRLQPVTLKFGLSEVFAENDDTGEYLSNNTPMTLVADASYQLASLDSTIGWRTRAAEKSDRGSSSLTRTDGYTVHDLYYRWSPDGSKNNTVTVDLGIDNLFDKAYSKRYGTLLEEGRSFVAKVSMKW